MTCAIAGWLPVFTRPDTVQIVFDSWEYLKRAKDIRCGQAGIGGGAYGLALNG